MDKGSWSENLTGQCFSKGTVWAVLSKEKYATAYPRRRIPACVYATAWKLRTADGLPADASGQTADGQTADGQTADGQSSRFAALLLR